MAKKKKFNYSDGWHPSGPGGKLQYWEKGKLKTPGTNAWKLLTRTVKEGNELIGKPLGMVATDVKSGLKDALSIGQYSDQVRDGKRLTLNQVKAEQLRNEGKVGTEGGLVRHLSELNQEPATQKPPSIVGDLGPSALSPQDSFLGNLEGFDGKIGHNLQGLSINFDYNNAVPGAVSNKQAYSARESTLGDALTTEQIQSNIEEGSGGGDTAVGKVNSQETNVEPGETTEKAPETKKQRWSGNEKDGYTIPKPTSIQKDLLKAGFTEDSLARLMINHEKNYGKRGNPIKAIKKLLVKK